MKWTFPKSAAVLAAIIAVSSAFTDPASVPWLTTLIGEHATTKLAALCSLVAMLSHSLQGDNGEAAKAAKAVEEGQRPSSP